MPLFDYECRRCGHQENDVLVRTLTDELIFCPACRGRDMTLFEMSKLPGTVSFKIKGLRAANGYGLKSIDTYGKSPVTDKETGCSFTSNRGGTIDHSLGEASPITLNF